MTGEQTSSLPKGLCRYEPALEQPLVDFLHEAYPERPAELLAPRWKWMFLESAQRLGVEPMVWLYVKDGRVLAHQGAIPVRCKIGDQQCVTGWFVETMALESVRGRAVGSMVIQKALEDMPFNLSLGQTKQMREIQLAMGWKQIGPFPTYAMLLNPKIVLESKIKRGYVRRVTVGVLTVRQTAQQLIHRPRGTTAYEAERIAYYNSSHDELWQQMRRELPCTIERDASFLNWKFVDQPGQDFVCLGVHRGGRLAAMATIVIRERDNHYPYRRGVLLDIVVPLGDRAAIWAVLDSVCHECQRRDADIVMFDVSCRRLALELGRYGFLRREATRFFLLAVDGLSDEQRQFVAGADNWYLTRADSDIDRPS